MILLSNLGSVRLWSHCWT